MSVSAGEQLAWEFVVAARWLAAGDPTGAMCSLLPGGAWWVRSPLDSQGDPCVSACWRPERCASEPAVSRWCSDALGSGRLG